ncbi:MAG: PaaI family thioesterase [Pseudomonadota bacterium]
MTAAVDAKAMLEAINAATDQPVARWLNYRVDLRDGTLIHWLGFEERHIGNPVIRALHGGVITAFLEFSAGAVLEAHTKQRAQAVNIAIDFLRSSKAVDMEARVTIRRLGRRIAFAEAIGWQDDENNPVAAAQCCFRML